MREIKFRAWDIGAERMIRDVHYAFLAGWLGAWTVTTVNSVFKQTTDRLIWLEYTGLKDKNGVEIYEGDAVRAELDAVAAGIHRDYTFFGRIVWQADEGCWTVYRDDTDEYFRLYETLELKVIGNIYENPELVAT